VTPPGLQPGSRHSERTKVLSVVLWGLGLSYRDAALVLKGLGIIYLTPKPTHGILVPVESER